MKATALVSIFTAVCDCYVDANICSGDKFEGDEQDARLRYAMVLNKLSIKIVSRFNTTYQISQSLTSSVRHINN